MSGSQPLVFTSRMVFSPGSSLMSSFLVATFSHPPELQLSVFTFLPFTYTLMLRDAPQM